MATYYFDTNGATAGFGTLTGAWDTTSALWTTATAGNIATSAVTFTNADTAGFGFAGTAATAGTATISTGITVTLNQITTANLAATQTIAASGTGALTLAGTTPTINVGSVGSLAISAPVSTSAGFTKAGTGTLTLGANSNPGLSGTITTNAGSVDVYPASSISNAITYQINAITTGTAGVSLRYTANTILPAGTTFSGPGMVNPLRYINVSEPPDIGVTFPAGALVGLTGTTAPSGTVPSLFPNSGLWLYATQNSLFTWARCTVYDLPSRLCFEIENSTAVTPNAAVTFAGSGGTYATIIDLICNVNGGGRLSSAGHIIYANQTASDLTITGTVNTWGVTGTRILYLLGTSAFDSYLTGVISNAAGTLGITKRETGTWVLSGANTFGGAVLLEAGKLRAANAAALGASSGTTCALSASTTLQITGGITLNKASTTFTTAGATIENLSGANTLTFSTLTKNASFAFTATADSLNVTNTITTGAAAQTLTINGPGTIRLSNTGSTYVSTTSIASGTLEVAKLADAAVASSIGAPAAAQATILAGSGGSAGLTHVGTTADSTARSITFSGGAGTSLTLGSSGTGVGAITYAAGGSVTFSGAGAHTLALTGTNSATNTFARTIADGGSGTTAVTKSGTNTWSLTGSITATGLFSITGGTLNFGATNRTLNGGLTINGGTVTITTGNTIAANTTFNAGTTFTPVLTGANTLTVGAGCTTGSPASLVPDAANGSNSFTGAVTINGVCDLTTPTGVNVATAGNGSVLGTSNTVTVSSTGVIRTKTASSSAQRGRARYNNLTLQSGAILRIGGAA